MFLNHEEIYKEVKHLYLDTSDWVFKVKDKKVDNSLVYILSFRADMKHDPNTLEDGEGITGALLPNGEYCLIPDKNHGRFSEVMLEVYPDHLHNNIIFLSRGSYSHIGVLKEPTQEQKEWLSEFKSKMNEGQLNSLEDLDAKLKFDLMPDLSDRKEVNRYDSIRNNLIQMEN